MSRIATDVGIVKSRASRKRRVGLVGSAAIAVAALALGPAGCTSSAPTRAGAASGSAPPASTQMDIQNVHAYLWSSGKYISVTATITNRSGRDDTLVGASSPAASEAGIYATSGCATPASAPSGDELCGKMAGLKYRIGPDESVELRTGDGEIILGSLVRAVSAGQAIEVDFIFANAPAVPVEVRVEGDS
jgi:copper(I)-binding protein